MADTTCSVCGKALSQANVLYNTSGNIVCVECSSKADIQGDEKRAAKNIKIASFSCVAAAVVGFVAFGMSFSLAFWPAAITSVASGIFAVNGLAGAGAERFVAYLSKSDKTLIWACCAVGFAITAFEALALGGAITFHPWLH